MKKLLVRFFQVVCLLQVFGYGQLNAHPLSSDTYSTGTAAYHHTGFVLTASQPASEISHSHSKKTVRFVFENIDEEEEEYESASPKKQSESAPCFSSVFSTPLPGHLHISKNSLALCKRNAFIPENKRYIVFSVFRI